ncbi:MAG TPA: nitroreductase/quinone reductase family protein [Solirubrobacterales bacterium]|nr:nitroreductase/quinone reductase family protein [Solirubrobacterales bacterium]
MTAEDLREALRDTSEVTLTTVGRRSGQESSRPIWFVEDGDRLLLLPVAGSDSNWYRNLVKTPQVRLAADGAELRAAASPIDSSAGVAEVVEKFREKYGADQVAEYYPKTDAAVEVPLV